MPYIGDLIKALEELEKLKKEEIAYINLMQLLNDPKAYMDANENKNNLPELKVQPIFNPIAINTWLFRLYAHNREKQKIICSALVGIIFTSVFFGSYPDLIDYKSDWFLTASLVVGFFVVLGSAIKGWGYWAEEKALTNEKRIMYERDEKILRNALGEKLPKINSPEQAIVEDSGISVESEKIEKSEPTVNPDATKVARALTRTMLNQYIRPNRGNLLGHDKKTAAAFEQPELTFNRGKLIQYLTEERDGKQEEPGFLERLKFS